MHTYQMVDGNAIVGYYVLQQDGTQHWVELHDWDDDVDGAECHVNYLNGGRGKPFGE